MMLRPSNLRPLAAIAFCSSMVALATSDTSAASIQSYTYTTDASIDGTVGTGYPISMTGQYYYSPNMLTTPGTFALGTVTTNPLPPGATLSFDNTGFTVDLKVYNSPPTYYYGYNYPTPSYDYTIHGVLNGSLKDGASTLFPSVTSITGVGSTPPFPIESLKLNLQGIAAPVGSTSSTTLLTATVDVVGTPLPAPAPEPTSIAAFAAALGGWAWKRRRRSA